MKHFGDPLASTATADPATVEELAVALRSSLIPLVRQLRRQGDSSHSQGSLSALAALDRAGRMTAGELARHEHITGPMVTKIAKLLETDGLITRTPSTEDARVSVLEPTSRGRRLMQRQRQAKNAWMARRLRTLDPGELAVLAAAIPVLDRLADRGRP